MIFDQIADAIDQAFVQSESNLEAREKAAQAKLLARLPAIAERAVGKFFTVQMDKKTSYKGVIQKVEAGGFYYVGRSVGLRFKITMLCGSAAVAKEFHVRTIPQ